MAHLTPQERKAYSEVFLEMDQDGNGWLSCQELAEGCRRLGFKVTQEEAEASFRAIDTNSDGRLTLDEFLAVMGHIEKSNPRAKKEAKLRRSFKQFDKNGSGSLSEKELQEGLRHAGYSVTWEQVEQLVQDLDKNGDGKIQFEEFIAMFAVDD